MRAAIVGAGVSGLTCGALLAAKGWQVSVYDVNDQVGGVCALAHKGRYSWEQGQLLMGGFLPGEPAYELLAGLGIRLPTVRADRGIAFPDFELYKPKEYGGPDWRKKRLKELFPSEASDLERWYQAAARIDRLGLKSAAGVKDIGMLFDWQRLKKYQDRSAAQLMDDFFSDRRLKTVWTGILADFCAYPSQFPGLGVFGLNQETAFDTRIPLKRDDGLTEGGYCYLVGGMQTLPEALAGYIQSHGGRIRLGTAVDKVLIGAAGAQGVRLADGTEQPADLVIGSGGGREFFTDLVGLDNLDEGYRHVIETFQPMDAVFMVHLGVDYDPRQFIGYDLIYNYGTYDIEGAVTRMRQGLYHGGDDGYLVYVPSNHAPAMAPQGHWAMTIYTVAPDTLAHGDWAHDREAYADRLVALAEEKFFPGLSRHVDERLVMTALEYRSLAHLHKSAFGGVTPILNQPNPAHVTPIKNLYFVGQQSENLGGVAAVMAGAKQTVKAIIG